MRHTILYYYMRNHCLSAWPRVHRAASNHPRCCCCYYTTHCNNNKRSARACVSAYAGILHADARRMRGLMCAAPASCCLLCIWLYTYTCWSAYISHVHMSVCIAAGRAFVMLPRHAAARICGFGFERRPRHKQRTLFFFLFGVCVLFCCWLVCGLGLLLLFLLVAAAAAAVSAVVIVALLEARQ